MLESAVRAGDHDPAAAAASTYRGFGRPGGGAPGADMAATIRACRAVGYDGGLDANHAPASDLDPARERFFASALGYARGLIEAT